MIIYIYYILEGVIYAITPMNKTGIIPTRANHVITHFPQWWYSSYHTPLSFYKYVSIVMTYSLILWRYMFEGFLQKHRLHRSILFQNLVLICMTGNVLNNYCKEAPYSSIIIGTVLSSLADKQGTVSFMHRYRLSLRIYKSLFSFHIGDRELSLNDKHQTGVGVFNCNETSPELQRINW